MPIDLRLETNTATSRTKTVSRKKDVLYHEI